MRDDIVFVLAEVQAKYLPQLKFYLETVPKRFVEPHPEFCKKTSHYLSFLCMSSLTRAQ